MGTTHTRSVEYDPAMGNRGLICLREKINPENLRRWHFDEGRDIRQISQICDVPAATIYYAFKRFGIERQQYEYGQHDNSSLEDVFTREYLVEQLVKGGMTAAQLAAHHDCSKATINKYMRRHGVSLESRERRRHRPEGLNRDRLTELYVVERRPTFGIGAMLGCWTQMVDDALAKYGIEVRERNGSRTEGILVAFERAILSELAKAGGEGLTASELHAGIVEPVRAKASLWKALTRLESFGLIRRTEVKGAKATLTPLGVVRARSLEALVS